MNIATKSIGSKKLTGTKSQILILILIAAFFEYILMRAVGSTNFTKMYRPIYLLLLYLWLERDKLENNYEGSFWFTGLIIALPELFLPVYFFKTCSDKKKAILSSCGYYLFIIVIVFFNMLGDSVYYSVTNHTNLIDGLTAALKHPF